MKRITRNKLKGVVKKYRDFAIKNHKFHYLYWNKIY